MLLVHLDQSVNLEGASLRVAQWVARRPCCRMQVQIAALVSGPRYFGCVGYGHWTIRRPHSLAGSNVHIRWSALRKLPAWRDPVGGSRSALR